MSHTLINCTWKIRLDFSLLTLTFLFTLFSFRLLWYHSILRRSIDQKHPKTNEIWRQNSEVHSAFACSHWPPGLPDLFKPYGACVKCRSGKHMFGLSLFRASRQSNISTSGEERFKYPLPRENKISQMPYPRDNKDNQIPTLCPAPPPSGFTLIGAFPWPLVFSPSLSLLVEIKFGASTYSLFLPFFVRYLFQCSKHDLFFVCFSFFLFRRIYPFQANLRSPVFARFLLLFCEHKSSITLPPDFCASTTFAVAIFFVHSVSRSLLVNGPSPSCSGTKMSGFKQNRLPLGLALQRQ